MSPKNPGRVNPFASLKAEVPPPPTSAPVPVSCLPRRRGSQTQLKTEVWPTTGVWAGGLSSSLVPSILAPPSGCSFYNYPFLQAFLCCEDRLLRQAKKGKQPEEWNRPLVQLKTEMSEAGLYPEGLGGHWSE